MERKVLLRYILVVAIVVLVLGSLTQLGRLLVILAFFAINFLTALAKRYIPSIKLRRYVFGIEIVLFCTVLSSVAFGSVIGMFMGFALMAINYIAEKRFSRYFVVTLLLYSIIGYTAYFFRGMDIIVLGIIITLIYNAISLILVIPLGANVKTMVVFNAVNIVVNSALFSLYGPFVLRILT